VRDMLLIVGALAAPALAAASGPCVYVPETTDKKPSYACTYVDDEAGCMKQAEKHGSAEWATAHPPKFFTGIVCNEAVKNVAPKSAKKSSKPASKAGAAK